MSAGLNAAADGLSGTLQLGGTDVVTFTSNGITSGLAVVNAPSVVRLNTANGYGSTNTVIRRFTNTVTNTGSDITYTDSATNGASFTINKAGIYAISYNDSSSASNMRLGVSLNSAQLTTNINSITAANRLAMTGTQAANVGGCCAWTGPLAASDVIRAHADGQAAGSDPVNFTIARIA